MPKSKYIKISEIAKELNVDRRTVYRYLQLNYFDYIKPAGIIYVTRASYERFLKYGKPTLQTACKTETQGGYPEKLRT
jgi:transcriptional antiterminator